MGHALDIIAPIALAAIGSVVAPGIGTALGTEIGSGVGAAAGAGLGSAGVNYSQTHSIGDALKAGALSGAGSFVGGNIANNLLGGSLGTVGSGIDSALGTNFSGTAGGQTIGELGGASGLPWAGSTLPTAAIGAGSSDIASALGGGAFGSAASSAFGTPISQIVGGYVGNSLASQYAPQGKPSNAGNYPWIPAAPGQPGGGAAVSMPSSLNSMSSLTPQQQATGLATQGVYGGGLGPQEQGYFGNLVQKQLTEGAPYKGVNDMSVLSPIENSYLSNLGFGNQGSSYNLAKALSQWNPSA